MKKFKFLPLIFLGLAISFSSCSDDDDDTPQNAPAATGPTQNIAEIAIADDRTDSLVVALSITDLVPTFQSAGTYTVFAPTNEAFRKLLALDPSWNRISDIDNDFLKNVLLYHVLGSVVRSTDLTDNTYGTTLNAQGSPNNESTVLEVDVTGGVKINNNATVTDPDIEATNGVIHIIDAVITPKNVVELAINDERFSTLVSALLVFGDTLTGVLSGPGPFTIFAPTNDAFQRLLDSNPAWTTLTDIPRATLNVVLGYHVVENANVQADELRQGQTITMINSGSLEVDLTNGAQLITSNMSQDAVDIIVTDVQGTNGVIHAVDEVLLP